MALENNQIENSNIDNDSISLKQFVFKIKEWVIYFKSKWKQIFIAGEFASANPKSIALTESVAFPISQKLDFSALFRYYTKGYFSPMAQALGEGSQTKNEVGLFLGNQFQIA